MIYLVPLAAALVFAFFVTLITNPTSLTSFGASLFFGIGFALMFIFIVYGFGGLWKRRKRGYWLGLLFLAVGTAMGLYNLMPTLYKILLGSNESTSLLGGYISPRLIVFGLVLQSLILLLFSGLFLKLLLGKNEKSFFNTPVNINPASSEIFNAKIGETERSQI